jgi:hypothetical protein
MSSFNSRAAVARRACLVSFALASPAAAQEVTAADLGTIAIAVVVPRSNTMLTVDQKNQLGNTLLQAATANGISGIGGPSGFQLTPMVIVTKEGEAGELQKFKYVTLNVTLAVKQVPQNLAFGSTSVILQGNAPTREDAITQALGNLSPTNEKIINLVESSKTKILQYYETSCDAIRSDAKARAGTGRVPEALTLLLTVPREATTCQKAAGVDADAMYAAYRDAQCDASVRAARAALAARDFEEAKIKAELVDPGSKCAKSADGVLKDLEKKVTSDHNFSLKIRAAIVNRDKIETSLSSPGESAKHTHEQAIGVAVDLVAKLPSKPHIIDHH